MTSFILFVVSGCLIVIMLTIQAFRLRYSSGLSHVEDEHPAGELFHDWKTFILSINRDSVSVFFRVFYRVITIAVSYVVHTAREIKDTFLSKMQGRDVRKEAGSASFYLKTVSMHKESMQAPTMQNVQPVEKKQQRKRGRRIEDGQ